MKKIVPMFTQRGDAPDPVIRVLPVMKRKSREPPQCVGSSFYAGTFKQSALFITARHVLEDIEGRSADAFVLLPTYSLEAVGEPDELLPLNVTKVCGSEPLSDAAILVTERPPVLPPQPAIDTDCPRAGDICTALGYSEMNTTISEELGSADTNPTVEFNFRVNRGFLEEVFPRRRDSSMAKFPGFQYDVINKPGMSGGPVVNDSGSVIGIVSTGYDTGPSYAILIAMIAELKVEVSGDHGPEKVSVADLIHRREIFNKANMSFTINGQDESTVVTWRESR